MSNSMTSLSPQHSHNLSSKNMLAATVNQKIKSHWQTKSPNESSVDNTYSS